MSLRPTRLIFAAAALAGCNAIFNLEEPTHKSGACADAGCAGNQGGTMGGSATRAGTGNAAASGSGGDETMAGNGGEPATGGTGDAAGRSGSAGSGATTGGGKGGSGGKTAVGGSGAEGGGAGAIDPCVEDPASCVTHGPSCENMSPTACNGESCCATNTIPACDNDTSCRFPNFTIERIAPFALDTYEVTVGRFRRFINAYDPPIGIPGNGDGAHPEIDNSGWDSAWPALPLNSNVFVDESHLTSCKESDATGTWTTSTWTDEPGDNEQKPINCLTWYEAFAFCVWDGGYLPTEQEWYYAATGGPQKLKYPWGNDDTTLNQDHVAYGYCDNGFSTECDLDVILDVGSKPRGIGPYGHFDLLGSMWEWMLDYSNQDFPLSNPCENCANLTPDENRVIRGASFWETESWINNERRHEDPPGQRWLNVGVRCARLPP